MVLTTAHSGVILGPDCTPISMAREPDRYNSGARSPVVQVYKVTVESPSPAIRVGSMFDGHWHIKNRHVPQGCEPVAVCIS
jgi:hypothetical protein